MRQTKTHINAKKMILIVSLALLVTQFLYRGAGLHKACALNEGDSCAEPRVSINDNAYDPPPTKEESCNACGGDLYCKTSTPTSAIGTCVAANGACDTWNTNPITVPGSSCTPYTTVLTVPVPEASCDACPGDYICRPSGYGSAIGVCQAANGLCGNFNPTVQCDTTTKGTCGFGGGCYQDWEECLCDSYNDCECMYTTDCANIDTQEEYEGDRAPNPFSVSGIMTLFKDTGPGTAASFFEILYRIILPIVIVIGMILTVLAGYGIMFSTGDPTKTSISKEKLTSAIIGLISTVFGAAILRMLISNIIGTQ